MPCVKYRSCFANLFSLRQFHTIFVFSILSWLFPNERPGKRKKEMLFKSKFEEVDIPVKPFSDFFFEHFDRYGDEVALVEGVSGQSYTFKQMKRYCRNVASAMLKKGWKKGDVVCIFSYNSPEYCIAFHGLASAGLTITTCNPAYTVEETQHQLRDSNARCVFTVRDYLPKVKDICEGVPHCNQIFLMDQDASLQDAGSNCSSTFGLFKDLMDDDGSHFCNRPKNLDPKNDVLVIPYSSGTTGLPKGVMLTHYNLVANLCQLKPPNLLRLDLQHDSLIAILPFFHIYGMVVIMSLALYQGAKVVSMKKFEPNSFLAAIQKYRVTVLPLVPPIILFLCKSPLVQNFDLSSVREIFSGAAPLGKDQAEEVTTKLGIKCLRQGYGMTELSPTSHFPPRDAGMKHGSGGMILPNTECKIVDTETGSPLPIGQDGEVCVRGPQVMKGYLNNQKATDETISKDGWLHTGDIGHFDEDHHLFITDRLKELIKCKGFQVPPAQLESILLTHPAVQECAVVGKPDDRAGELPKAYVVLKQGEVTSALEIQNYVAERVAPYKRLAGGVEFTSDIPKNASGKLLRRVLKQKEVEAYNKK